MASRSPRWLRIAGVGAALTAPQVARGQVLSRQPHCEAIHVELQSLLDEVHLYPGDLVDPPYLYRGWTTSPRIDLSQTFPIATLRIFDHALTDELRPDAEDWTIELMPAHPTSFDLRMDGGKGRFDFTGMPVQDLTLFATFTEVKVDFGRPNPIRLATGALTIQSGSLDLRGLLHAAPDRVIFRLPRTKARVDLTGRAFTGEAEIVFDGMPQSLQLGIPPDLPLWIDAPPATLRSFTAAGWQHGADERHSDGWETAACRVHLRFPADVKNLTVEWREALALGGAARELTSRPPTPPATAAPEHDADRRVAAILAALERHAAGDAQAQVRELAEVAPADPRLAVLQAWLRDFSPSPPLPGTAPPGPPPVHAGPPPPRAPDPIAGGHLRIGLRLYLLGEYSNALSEFAAARVDPGLAGEAEAWMRRTQSEIERLQPAATAAPPPPVVERIVTRTSSPVFALRTPATAVAKVRRATLQLAGQVADDLGIDRVEVSVNGRPLLDADGSKLQVRPDEAANRLPFTIPIPLQSGENQIVVTAYDTDTPPRWTSEQLAVTRLPPLWRTLPAAGAALLLGFAVAAWITITRLVKSRIAFVNKYNPYVAGLPVRNAELLFGREPLLQSVLNTIHSNSIMLHGPRRIGKTSLQLELKRRLELARDPDYHFIPVFVDLQGTTEESFFATVMIDILEAARPHLRGQAPAGPDASAPYTSREFSRDLRATLAALQATTPKKLKVVLLLDEVDQLNRYSEQTNQKLRAVFMKTFAESLVAVMSGTHIEKQWRSEGSPWYNFFEEIEVGKLSRDDAIRLIRTPVHGIFTYEQAAVDRILEYSACEPYIIQRLCVHAINRIIEARRRRVRAEDIDAVREQAVQVADEAA